MTAHSQIYKGGDICVKKTLPNGNTFSVNVRVAINWPIAINKPYLKINWGDGSQLDSIPYVGSNCTLYGASTLKYSGTHTFSPSGTYLIGILDSFLVANISNIPNSSSQKLFLQNELNTNTYAQPNANPYSLGCLTDSSCCYNPSMTDSDGDSLSFQIVTPVGISGYTMPPATINQVSGSMTFTTYVPGLTNVSLRIDEWRKNLSNVYVKIGSTYQELLFKMPTTVGIREEDLDHILTIFPNPASDMLTIDLHEAEIDMISISNLIGQEVLVIHPKQSSVKINFGELPSGVYFLKAGTNNKFRTVKIFKL